MPVPKHKTNPPIDADSAIDAEAEFNTMFTQKKVDKGKAKANDEDFDAGLSLRVCYRFLIQSCTDSSQ